MKTLMMILMALVVMGCDCVDGLADAGNDASTEPDAGSDTDTAIDCAFTCQYSGLSVCLDGLYPCTNSSCPNIGEGLEEERGNCCGPYGC